MNIFEIICKKSDKRLILYTGEIVAKIFPDGTSTMQELNFKKKLITYNKFTVTECTHAYFTYVT